MPFGNLCSEMVNEVQRFATRMCQAVLLVIAKLWKWKKYARMELWLNKLWDRPT